MAQKTPIQMIQEERERQQKVEGWTPEHDDQHTEGSLGMAAACYAAPYDELFIKGTRGNTLPVWPWDKKWDKRQKHSRMKQLAIAGALVVAELERLQRAEAKEKD